MNLLTAALKHDPGTPRLTVYVDHADPHKSRRMDLSAITLDNWASKLGNYFLDEAMLEPGDTLMLAMPVRWQTAVVILGALRAGITLIDADAASDHDGVVDGVITFVESLQNVSPAEHPADLEDPFSRYTVPAMSGGDVPIYVCVDDPFGRSIEDCDIDLDSLGVDGVVDLVGEARLCPDAFMGDDTAAAQLDRVILRDHDGHVTVGEVRDAGRRWFDSVIRDYAADDAGSADGYTPNRVFLDDWSSVRDFVIVADGAWMNGGSLVIYSDEAGVGRGVELSRSEKALIGGYPG